MMGSGQESSPWPCLRQHGREGLLLDLVVSPNAQRTQADGLHDGALRVRLAAPPVDGRANAALLAWLADELGMAQRQLRLVRGLASRRKQVALDGASEKDVARWLARVLAPG